MAWDNLNLSNDTNDTIDKNKEKHIELAKNYHSCFKTEAGAKVMGDLMSRFVINNHTQLNAANITYEAGYHAGEAGVVRFIMKLIQQAEVI